eukprot:GHVN01041363.1.p1 GENE.GHVN01041363.1~~GHVN01041363.1.p1  ORF type:complete len:250 (+),score=16.40 GHVN01041363.1:301-1050(+)
MVLLARSNSGLLVGLALASFSTAEAGTFVSRQPAPWKPVRERASLKYSISQTEPPPEGVSWHTYTESTSGLQDKSHDKGFNPSDLFIMFSILTAGGALCFMLLVGLACFHIAQRKAEQKKRLQKRLSTFTMVTSSTSEAPGDDLRRLDSLTVITSTIVDKRKQARREETEEVNQYQVSDNRLSQLRKKLLNLPPPPNAPRRSSCPSQSPPAPIREFMRGSTVDCTLEQSNIIDYSSAFIFGNIKEKHLR